jgi:hypothetical protein
MLNEDPLYVEYHDTEWGVPVHGDKEMFERLVLEGVERVVMDEDADGPLGGQKPCGAVDRPLDLLGAGRTVHQAGRAAGHG